MNVNTRRDVRSPMAKSEFASGALVLSVWASILSMLVVVVVVVVVVVFVVVVIFFFIIVS